MLMQDVVQKANLIIDCTKIAKVCHYYSILFIFDFLITLKLRADYSHHSITYYDICKI
jgi:hypothetical protein